MGLIDPDIAGQNRILYIYTRSRDDDEQRETIKELTRAHSDQFQDGEALDQDYRMIPDVSVESLIHFRMRTTRQWQRSTR